MQEEEIQSLIDQRNIHNVLARYCFGADRRDTAMMKACYWPDATDDHGLMPALNAHEFVDKAASGTIISHLRRTIHTLGQVSCEVKDNRARVESYVICYQRVINEPTAVGLFFGRTYAEMHENDDCDSHDILGGGRYLDIFEKRGNEWRILKRVATGEWKLVGPASTVLDERATEPTFG